MPVNWAIVFPGQRADVGPNGGRKYEERFNWEISLWIFWGSLENGGVPVLLTALATSY